MPPEGNGPDVKLPSSGDLAGYLDGSDAPVDEVEDDGAPLKDVELDELPAGDSFDRKYVEKLRRENASYRERAKKFETAFEGYEDGAVEEWKSLISGFKSDPAAAAQYMADLSANVLQQFNQLPEDKKQEVLDDANAHLDADEKPLTRRELEQFYAQKQEEQELSGMVQDIEYEATELGYNLKSREYKLLLMTAQEIPSGDLKEAHNILMADRQRAIDEYVTSKGKDAGRKVPVGNLVGVPDTSNQIKSFKDAKTALEQFLDANK
jgi:hypothetical protein